MNIFLHELKSYGKSTLIWSVSLVALLVLFMSMYPSIAADIDSFKKLLDSYPEAVRKAIGLEVENLGSVLGFYAYIFLYLSLCGAIQGMNIGTSIISKEIRDKTADFLMTKPVSRITVLTSKILAALTSLVATNMFFLTAASMMLDQVKTEEYSAATFFMITATLFYVQLIFIALGVVISVIARKIKSVLTLSLGTVFTFFIVGMLVSTGNNEAKRYLSPFKYFDTAAISRSSSYEPSFLLAGAGIVLISLLVSYFVFIRKDIHAV
ncbi:ABC-2 type transport system permease protein [Paenibacillus endophyticus]|uniref:ABC-2 type transport system permease protein n=1 Tax=Paenibacillus endophyticus TaxID=1294268 RepID=A0A7W5C9X9_9BACL|nr:ABC transporter permease subunit [Paenibacillus endophyticus]MBB3153808.1 ABC-2 type transport system permease protein [Paenibacillus endophyticus]